MRKLINPKRRNTMYLIYTEAEGGYFKVIYGWTQKKFNDLKKKGYMELKLGDRTPDKIYPAFAALAKGIDNNDFRIDEINRTRPEPMERIIKGIPFSRLRVNNRGDLK